MILGSVGNILSHKLQRMVAGLDPGPVIVVDLGFDLWREVGKCVAPELADRVVAVDFRGVDREVSRDLLDPFLFPDKDLCAGWDGAAEDMLRKFLAVVCGYDFHSSTPRGERLGLQDLLLLLFEGSDMSGSSPALREAVTAEKRRVFAHAGRSSLEEFYEVSKGCSGQVWPAARGVVQQLAADLTLR